MEETPLINGFSDDEHHYHQQIIGDDGDYRPITNIREWWAIFCVESVKLWRIGGPIAFNIICQYGVNSLTNIFVGHLGDIELSAIAIAQSVIGTFSFGFMLGMGSALETLCGQAYGAGQIHMLGVYMQRSIIILFVTCILLLPIYLFATPVLKLLGQESQIAELAGEYAILIIPQLFSLSINFPTSKFLQAQSKVDVIAWIGFVVLLMHATLLWLFIYTFGWGTTGAAIAFNLTSWVLAIAQFAYVVGWCKDGWKGLSWAAFNEIWSFVRLSIASAIMLCLEIWYMMSIIILVGHLDNAVIAVGSISICMNVNGYEGMLFIGVNAAISVRVSNELGLGRPRATKYCVYISVFQSLLIGLLCMVIVMVAREHLAIIFTSSKDMQQAVGDLSYLLGITMVLNSVQPVISGVAVGGGWQALVAYINLGSYYIFGLPLGFILGYVAKLGDVNVIEKADAVNEEGSSALGLVLHGAAVLLKWKMDWDWFVNLDASDYPLIPQDDFLHILSFVPRNLNFIEYNMNISPEEYQKALEVIVDSRLYILLRGKMFVGDRKRLLPSAFKLFMGSQHVILNRKFVEYSIQGWENLPRLLLLYFTNTRSSHRGYFQTLACNTMEFSDAVINSNLRFINSDNTARDPSDFRAPSSDRILKREVAFVGNVSADSPLLDMIDAHILHRGYGMVSPGGWCLGSSNWFSDPCGEWGDPSVLRPGPAAKGLENFLMKSIKNMSIKSSRCDHQ